MRRAFTVMLLSLSLMVAGAACSKDSNSSKSDKKSGEEASSTKKDDEKSSGKGGGKYCDFSRAANEATQPNPTDLPTPAEMLDQMAESEELMNDAADLVPDEIEADFKIFAAAFSKYIAALKDAEGNIMEIDPAAAAAMGSPEVIAASQRMSKYNEEVCGIKTSS